jgi:RNA polymerase sigma-70 factor (ECF subfamily)
MVPNDTELIQQARQGNMNAFEQLVQRYDERVLSIATTYVNDVDDAKDIYQEVFIRVYKGLPRFQFKSEFSTWIYRIASNVCLTFTAKKKRHTTVSLSEEHEQDDNQSNGVSKMIHSDSRTDQHAINAEIASRVRDALDELSPQQRMVFTLRHYEGYKLREIAKMMNCAEGTVKKYLFTATRRMREQLEEIFA